MVWRFLPAHSMSHLWCRNGTTREMNIFLEEKIDIKKDADNSGYCRKNKRIKGDKC